MKDLFRRIYLKLYLWFLLIFVVTLFIVLILSSGFYASRIHEEMESYFVSHAQFLQNEYLEACGDSYSARSCDHFLRRVARLPQIHFWVLDPSGNVLVSHEVSPPHVDRSDLQRALSGEVVTNPRGRVPSMVLLPVRRTPGHTSEVLVLERSLLGRRLLRFPLFFSLAVAGIAIAILVLPLSLRLTKPIRELHRMAQEWAEGHLEKRVVVSRGDEIGDLARVFNTMAENLQKNLQQRKEFLAFISHELKSPLARMRIALELLSEKESDKTERRKLLESVHADIAESERLIEQLLLLSRIEMNLPTLTMGPVDIDVVTQRALEQVKPFAEAAHITLEMRRQGTDGQFRVSGDASSLQRAIVNVVENAVKFSRPGGLIQITVTQSGGRVLAQFSDQGSGIRPEDQEKIFEPFYRGAGTETKEGAGLGLFLARRIIEIHNGRISALPNHPAGTIVTIELPGRL